MSFDLVKKKRISFVQFINEEKINSSDEIEVKLSSYETQCSVNPRSSFSLREVCSLVGEIKREMLHLNRKAYTRLSVDGVRRISFDMDVKDDLNRVKAEIDSVYSELEEREARISELEKEKNELLSIIDQKSVFSDSKSEKVKLEVESIQSELKERTSQLSKLENERNQLLDTLNQKNSFIGTLKRSLDRKNEKISDLQKRTSGLESQLKSERSSLEDLIKTKDDRLSLLEEKAKKLASENEQLRSRIVSVYTDLDNHTSQMFSELESERDQLLADLNQKNSSIEMLKRSISRKEKEHLELQQRVNALEQRLKNEQLSLENELKIKKDELASLEEKAKKLETLEEVIKTKDNEIDLLEEKAKEFESKKLMLARIKIFEDESGRSYYCMDLNPENPSVALQDHFKLLDEKAVKCIARNYGWRANMIRKLCLALERLPKESLRQISQEGDMMNFDLASASRVFVAQKMISTTENEESAREMLELILNLPEVETVCWAWKIAVDKAKAIETFKNLYTRETAVYSYIESSN